MTMSGAAAATVSYGTREFEQKLLVTGKILLQHLSAASVDQILKLLDILESMLLQVEQGPSPTVEKALLPSMTALIEPKLFKHPSKDVRVSVAACLTEIMRIIAPQEPYSVQIMEEIFKLTVTSFGWLSYVSSRGYTKAISILDSFSRVRACALMLDLECDALIADMFRIFFNAIKYKHAPVVVLAMENIMVTALDESEEIEIPWHLLGQLLVRVKNDQDTSSPAWKLAKNVLCKCSATKLKRFLLEAVQDRGLALNEYAPIVAAICRNEVEKVKASDLPLPDEQKKSAEVGSDKQAEVTKELSSRACPEEVLQAEDIVTKDKSSIEAETGLRKRSRKLNPLINSDEGYDPWTYTKRSGKSVAKVKKDNDVQAEDIVAKDNDDDKSKEANQKCTDSKPETLDSMKGDKSSIEAETGLGKRSRKLNPLINSDEGYDPWTYSSSRRTTKISAAKVSAELSSVKKKTNSSGERIPKRKQSAGKGEVSEILSDGPELVGKRIKVWWPLDKTFYEGVVDSYDSVKKKQKVLYTDGEEEILSLKTEKWKVIDDDDSSNRLQEKTGEEKTEHQERANSSDTDESIDLNK